MAIIKLKTKLQKVIKVIKVVLILQYLIVNLSCAQSLEDIVQQGVGQAGAYASQDKALEKVPREKNTTVSNLKSKTDHIGNKMASTDDANIKAEGNKELLAASSEDKDKVTPHGIISKAMEKEPKKIDIEKMEEHKMFKKAAQVYKDPEKAMMDVNKSLCQGISKNKENADRYTKRKYMQKMQDTEYEEVHCEVPSNAVSCEKVLKIKCEDSIDCDSGGIITGSISGDVELNYVHPHLNFGTIGDNYWGGHCAEYKRKAVFTVKNKHLIDEVKLIRVSFDDHLMVKVNGVIVYNGPHGGNDLKVIKQGWHKYVNKGSAGDHGCELNTSWNIPLDIDILPHLQEGQNEIDVVVIVGGAGEFSMQIRTKQHCCAKPKDIWEKRCWQN